MANSNNTPNSATLQLAALQMQQAQLARQVNQYAGTVATSQPYVSAATDTYSLAMIQLERGEMVSFMVKAAPTLAAHIIKVMKEQGFLHLFNDTETLVIRADKVVAFTMQRVSTEG